MEKNIKHVFVEKSDATICKISIKTICIFKNFAVFTAKVIKLWKFSQSKSKNKRYCKQWFLSLNCLKLNPMCCTWISRKTPHNFDTFWWWNRKCSENQKLLNFRFSQTWNPKNGSSPKSESKWAEFFLSHFLETRTSEFKVNFSS